MSFQTCMTFFLCSIKEENFVLTIEINGYQNFFFCVLQMKVSHKGLEQCEGKKQVLLGMLLILCVCVSQKKVSLFGMTFG